MKPGLAAGATLRISSKERGERTQMEESPCRHGTKSRTESLRKWGVTTHDVFRYQLRKGEESEDWLAGQKKKGILTRT